MNRLKLIYEKSMYITNMKVKIPNSPINSDF